MVLITRGTWWFVDAALGCSIVAPSVVMKTHFPWELFSKLSGRGRAKGERGRLLRKDGD